MEHLFLKVRSLLISVMSKPPEMYKNLNELCIKESYHSMLPLLEMSPITTQCQQPEAQFLPPSPFRLSSRYSKRELGMPSIVPVLV
jgi:hypothetical protein